MLSDRFRTAVEAGEIAGATELFREDAVFRSPVVYRPYAGRDAVLKHENRLGLGPGPRRPDPAHPPRPIPALPRARRRGLAAGARGQEHGRYAGRADSPPAAPSRLTARRPNDPGKRRSSAARGQVPKKFGPHLDPVAHCWTPLKTTKTPRLRGFCAIGETGLNLRPPGPQPGSGGSGQAESLIPLGFCGPASCVVVLSLMPSLMPSSGLGPAAVPDP